jgi:hypothetical protein
MSSQRTLSSGCRNHDFCIHAFFSGVDIRQYSSTYFGFMMFDGVTIVTLALLEFDGVVVVAVVVVVVVKTAA